MGIAKLTLGKDGSRQLPGLTLQEAEVSGRWNEGIFRTQALTPPPKDALCHVRRALHPGTWHQNELTMRGHLRTKLIGCVQMRSEGSRALLIDTLRQSDTAEAKVRVFGHGTTCRESHTVTATTKARALDAHIERQQVRWGNPSEPVRSACLLKREASHDVCVREGMTRTTHRLLLGSECTQDAQVSPEARHADRANRQQDLSPALPYISQVVIGRNLSLPLIARHRPDQLIFPSAALVRRWQA